jgi:Protein of unknown function (DUF2817)
MVLESTYAENYAQARQLFLQAAQQAGAKLSAYAHPLRGVQGEDLALDVGVVGSSIGGKLGTRSTQCLLVTSGCHGVEGYCGSAIQVATLNNPSLLEIAAANELTLIFAHALNPYGFSFGRRVNEDNVDLNRNFHDFSRPLPRNDAYAPLHALLIPKTWPPSSDNEAALMGEFQRHGMAYMQGAITGGQHTHPGGLHYSHTKPVWSHLQTRRLFADFCSEMAHIAWIDLHSGLGPSGVGERMFSPCYAPENGDQDAPMWERANAWWNPKGNTPLTRVGKNSASSEKITGNLNAPAVWECPQAMFTKLTLEFGTLPPLAVLQAMRAEQWLELNPTAPPEQAHSIKKAMRDAFFVDTPEWKAAVVQQGVEAIEQAVIGMLP